MANSNSISIYAFPIIQMFKKGAAVLATALAVYFLIDSRLSQRADSYSVINNALYDSIDWWAESGPVSLLGKMNTVRVAYFLRYLPKGRILDVGCGGGFVSEALAGAGFQMTGVDMSTASIAAAAAHAKSGNLKIDYVVADAMHLPFGDSTFDGVVISDVLEHLTDLNRAVSEIFRVLRPGGVVVFDTINRTPFSYLCIYIVAQELLGILPKNAHDPHLFIKPAELSLILESVGFETNPSTWTGISPVFDPITFFQTLRVDKLISGFWENRFDLSGSYQGWARK